MNCSTRRHLSSPRLTSLGALALACALSACATSAPVVYQKAQPNTAQSERTAKDIRECRQRAQAAVGVNGRGAERTVQASARAGAIGLVGTAVGAVVNSSKDAWQRARAGAAGGAAGMAAKTLLEWNDPDKVYQEYVERCLDERGHDVLGWR